MSLPWPRMIPDKIGIIGNIQTVKASPTPSAKNSGTINHRLPLSRACRASPPSMLDAPPVDCSVWSRGAAGDAAATVDSAPAPGPLVGAAPVLLFAGDHAARVRSNLFFAGG